MIFHFAKWIHLNNLELNSAKCDCKFWIENNHISRSADKKIVNNGHYSLIDSVQLAAKIAKSDGHNLFISTLNFVQLCVVYANRLESINRPKLGLIWIKASRSCRSTVSFDMHINLLRITKFINWVLVFQLKKGCERRKKTSSNLFEN